MTVIPIGPKTQLAWQRTLRSCFLSSFFEFCSAVSKKSKMSQPIKRRAVILFFWSAQKHKLGREHWALATCQVSFQRFQSKSRKCFGQSEARAPIMIFRSARKTQTCMTDAEILFHVKFRWIPFCSFRKVENVSANQKPGRPSCFSNRPENHKLGRGRWYLVFCQVSLNSVQRFQRRSRKCRSKSEARAAILFFRPPPPPPSQKKNW